MSGRRGYDYINGNGRGYDAVNENGRPVRSPISNRTATMLLNIVQLLVIIGIGITVIVMLAIHSSMLSDFINAPIEPLQQNCAVSIGAPPDFLTRQVQTMPMISPVFPDADAGAYQYPDSTGIAIRISAPFDYINSLCANLPAHIIPVPGNQFMYITYFNHRDSTAGSYREIIINPLVIDINTNNVFAYVAYIYVDTEAGCYFGREMGGFSKKIVHFLESVETDAVLRQKPVGGKVDVRMFRQKSTDRSFSVSKDAVRKTDLPELLSLKATIGAPATISDVQSFFWGTLVLADLRTRVLKGHSTGDIRELLSDIANISNSTNIHHVTIDSLNLFGSDDDHFQLCNITVVDAFILDNSDLKVSATPIVVGTF